MYKMTKRLFIIRVLWNCVLLFYLPILGSLLYLSEQPVTPAVYYLSGICFVLGLFSLLDNTSDFIKGNWIVEERWYFGKKKKPFKED